MHGNTQRKDSTALLLRHGETDYSKDRYYADEIEDPPLNALGQKQAQNLKHYLKESSGVTAIYVSPSRRTQETAEISTRSLGLKMETIDGLRERTMGKWGGLTAQEVQTQFPDEWAAWKEDMVHYVPPDGESLLRFSIRVKETLRKLVSRHPEVPFLLVSHVGPIRMIVTAALGIPLLNFKRLVIRNCSVTEIEFSDKWPNLHSLSYIP